MSRPPFRADPVYDVHDLGTGSHDRYICGWDVVDAEGSYADGPYNDEPSAWAAAERFNRSASIAKAEGRQP